MNRFRMSTLGCAMGTAAMALMPALASARLYAVPSDNGSTPLQRIQSVRGNISPRRSSITKQLVRSQVLKDRKMNQGLNIEEMNRRTRTRQVRKATPVRTPTAGSNAVRSGRYEDRDLGRRTKSFLMKMEKRALSDDTQPYGREHLSR